MGWLTPVENPQSFWFENPKNRVQVTTITGKWNQNPGKERGRQGNLTILCVNTAHAFDRPLKHTRKEQTHTTQLQIKEAKWDLSCQPIEIFQFECNQVICPLKQINQCSSKISNRLHTVIFIFIHSHDITRNYIVYEELWKCKPLWIEKAIIWY